MRIILTILAVISVIFSGLLMLAGCLIFLVGIMACFNDHSRWSQIPLFLPFLLVMSAGFAYVGAILAARAYRHLRQPDWSTACDVVGIATFLLLLNALSFLRKKPLIALPKGQADPLLELGLFLAVVIAAYLFHRLVLKRLAARAFPPETIESHA